MLTLLSVTACESDTAEYEQRILHLEAELEAVNAPTSTVSSTVTTNPTTTTTRPPPVPPFVPPPLVLPDPAALDVWLNDYALPRIGRYLTVAERVEMIAFIEDQIYLAYQVEVLVGHIEHIRVHIAHGAVPSGADLAILDTPIPHQVNPQARFERYFDERMAGAIALVKSQEGAQRLREILTNFPSP